MHQGEQGQAHEERHVYALLQQMPERLVFLFRRGTEGRNRKFVDGLDWLLNVSRTCKTCRAFYDQRKKDADKLRPGTPVEAPCETCKVELLPDNYEAAKVYNLCQGQYRTAGPDNMPIAGDVTAIISVMEVCRVRDKPRCLEKVLAAFNHFISKGAENASR